MEPSAAVAPSAPVPVRPRPPRWLARWAAVVAYLSEDLFGGPRVLKFAWVINFQKGATGLFVLALMWAYDNWSIDAWVYLALHGSYGVLWCLKHLAFPDPGWEKRITLAGAVMAWAGVLGPYWVAPFLLVSGVLGPRPGASAPLIAGCIALYVFGVVLMMCADCQKYFTLKYRRGLIDEGMFKVVRHTNYVGEMMLYASFALLVRHWVPWAILATVWIVVFAKNIMMKEVSLSRYPGFAAYKKRSGLLVPYIG